MAKEQDTFYHWAPRVCRGQIAIEGLRSAVELGDEEGWDTVFMTEERPKSSGPDEDIWQVDATGLEMWVDEGREQFLMRGGRGAMWFQTPGPVGPERLTLLSE